MMSILHGLIILLRMKIDLSKDPLFQREESPAKEFKKRELERQKQMRIRRMNPVFEKQEPTIEVVDPLPKQLQTHRAETQIRTNLTPSKASNALKKYVIEQERKYKHILCSLKCIRLQRIDDGKDKKSRSLNAQLAIEGIETQQMHKENKKINIPDIHEMFKHQQKEFVLYDSNEMKNTLTHAIDSIKNSVTKVQNYPYLGKTLPISYHQRNNRSEHDRHQHHIPRKEENQEDLQIEETMERRLRRSQRLCEKLYNQKKEMMMHQVNKESIDSKTMGFFFSLPEKRRKKVDLQGIKSVTCSDPNNNKLKVTPASYLLFELNKLYNSRDLKEQELSGLLKNSYKNRGDILDEKANFYDSKTHLRELSPKDQFNLRKQMDRRLEHRLKLSIEQVNDFINLLHEIKRDYHIILNQTMLAVLKDVREALVQGKVMKKGDFKTILQTFDSNQMQGKKNEKIICRLDEMMI